MFGSMQLLLVEDDSAMRTTLQRTLMRRGLSVDVAADGPSALAHWQTREPDAVVLDTLDFSMISAMVVFLYPCSRKSFTHTCRMRFFVGSLKLVAICPLPHSM